MISSKTIKNGLKLARAGRGDLIPNDKLVEMLELLQFYYTGGPKRENFFGTTLQFHRNAAGLTRKELAEKAGVSESGIQRYERGDRIACATIQKKLANALNIPVETFHPKP